MLYREFSTQEELDAQYDLSRSVPDPASYMEYRIKASEEARKELECEFDVPYGPTLAERLDIFPASEPEAPILVFIHGGYWHDPEFIKNKYSWVAKGPVSGGVTTVLPDYALCPKVTIDEIVRQCRAAVAWVYRNAASFGGDRSRIYVTGNSAGGHLTAMVLETDWEGEYGLPADVIKGGFPISGLFDLHPFPYTFLQPKLQLGWGEVLRNSPLLHIPESAPPMLVTYGGEEPSELRRQSDDFLAAWKAKGLKGAYLPQPDRNHFTAIEDFLEANSPLCDAIFKQMGLKPFHSGQPAGDSQ